MAKSSAKMMTVPPPMLGPMLQPVVAQAQTPHGMSLAIKPQRKPHPTAPGRDTFGRMLPGVPPRNAAPPFKAKAAKKAPIKVAAVVVKRPAPAMPSFPGAPPPVMPYRGR